MPENSLVGYYSRRASEYEAIYARPERQVQLSSVLAWLTEELQGHDILELACGTGYWTVRLAPTALSIKATDASPEVLDIARLKPFPPQRVTFELADAYDLDRIEGKFNAAFLGFWWSHVPRGKQPRFLDGLHRRIGAGGKIVMIDNLYVEGSSTPIARHDDEGNSYQVRRLADGSTHEVLKNFPRHGEFEQLLASSTTELSYRTFEYFWGVRYILKDVME
jgi:demethylmenaquinone methyltransferase/2-methoxy-6-polyprenyl-1,4-benzoquinol methylase